MPYFLVYIYLLRAFGSQKEDKGEGNDEESDEDEQSK